MTWQRTLDGYERRGTVHVEITDNGGGFGRAKGSGRWALTVDGRWIENLDTLAEAKARAANITRGTTS